MKKLSLLILVTVFYLSACTNQNESANYQKTIDSLNAILTADHSSDVAAIMQADSTWDLASAAKSAEGWLSYYTDDAIMMPPGENVCTDKALREKSIKNMFAVPGMSLRFQSTKVEVSKMGDLGYASGVYQWTSNDDKGKVFHENGKYCEIWKKQADGNWKCIVDIWNADAPLAK
jgi:ketosteroid isomerase-like protein